MDKRQVEKAIIKKFHLREPMLSLPWCCGKRYDRYTLGTLLGEMGFNVGAEIGVRRGNFSKYLCEQNPNLNLYCIDPWHAYSNKYNLSKQEGIYKQAVENTKGLNVTIIRKNSTDALLDFVDGSLDFAFIDGDHTFDYACPDIIYWSRKVRKNGIVIVHDYYGWSGAGVRQAVDAYTSAHHIDPWFSTKEAEPTAFWVKP